MGGLFVIEVLVCDLGQVLLGFDFSVRADFLRRCCSRHPRPTELTVRIHEEMGLTTGGELGEEFHRRLCAELGLDLSYEAFCGIWSDRFWEQADVIDTVGRTRVPKRVLLSNTDCIHWEWVRTRFPKAFQCFDHLLASHEIGLAKPDLACFRAVERITGYPPKAHLLVDDIAENVEGARAAGWDAVQFTAAPQLVNDLRQRGLL